MKDSIDDAMTAREGPVPTLAVADDDVDASSSEVESNVVDRQPHRDGADSRRTGRLRDEGEAASKHDSLSIQDRLLTRLLSQVIPPSGELDGSHHGKADYHVASHATKPAFSLPIMSSNFRRFNARIGIVFVFQNKVARLLSWRKGSHTLSLLATYSFVCLDPYLLVALPLAVALLFILVPAFISRHPPPPHPITASSTAVPSHDPHSAYSYSGPPLAPARTIKPAPETSKDFFRNMRDLQNSMSDFSDVHDALVSTIAPATNFSNEVLSSTVFLVLTILTTVLFVGAHLIPFRLIFLLGGDAMIISGHPQVQAWLSEQQKRVQKQVSRKESKNNADDTQMTINIGGVPVTVPNNTATQMIRSATSSLSQITLSTTPELREVEIFELQYRPLLPAYPTNQTASTNPEMYEWQPHLFTATPYDPLSPARISGERPRGTRFFEDVQPPSGWDWSNKKWKLDFEASEWVTERLIVGVEYDVLHRDDADEDLNLDEVPTATHHEGKDSENNDSTVFKDGQSFVSRRQRKQSINFDFGGWVWDLPPAPGTTHDRDEEVWLAYGDYDIPSLSSQSAVGGDKNKDKKTDKKSKDGKKGHGKKGSNAAAKGDRDWEETVRYGNKERTGEWRRRRWVRLVRRRAVDAQSMI